MYFVFNFVIIQIEANYNTDNEANTSAWKCNCESSLGWTEKGWLGKKTKNKNKFNKITTALNI